MMDKLMNSFHKHTLKNVDNVDNFVDYFKVYLFSFRFYVENFGLTCGCIFAECTSDKQSINSKKSSHIFQKINF